MRESYSTKSYLKDISLELPDYRFRHKPFQQEDTDNFEFIGREQIRKQFLETLLNGCSSGAYLVAGYRGMGKTSFINKVLSEYSAALRARRAGRVRVINVSLGKADITHGDLLRQLILALQNALLSRFHRSLVWMIRPIMIFNLSVVFFFVLLVRYIFSSPSSGPLSELVTQLHASQYESAYLIIMATLSFLGAYLVITGLAGLINIFPTIRLHKRLIRLYARFSSEITEEENVQSLVKHLSAGFFSKSTTKYPPMGIKEAELELIEIVKRLDRSSMTSRYLLTRWYLSLRRIFNRMLTYASYYRENIYLFVFDEMDKIEPGHGKDESPAQVRSSLSEGNKTYIDDYRDKKSVMVSIISSLKNLINESRARYVFVTGREMYEAALADITDRQNSIGSIFHKITPVDSFLKDTVGEEPAGLSNVIENYLKAILIPPGFVAKWAARHNHAYDPNEESFLKVYNDLLEDESYMSVALSMEERMKVICFLQQFIISLTYRSNGSPKKLTRLIEDLIKQESASDTPRWNAKPEIRVRFKVNRARKKKRKAAKQNTLLLHFLTITSSGMDLSPTCTAHSC